MRSIATLILVFTTTCTFAQGKPFKATSAQAQALKKQAQACANALEKQNYKLMAYYTYPPIVTAMGGPEKMAAKLGKSMQQMQAQGFSFKSVTIGDVKDIVASKGDLYSIVQDILQISMNGTLITSSSYLLAYSHNNGIRWYFVDTAPVKKQDITKLFPTYPKDLVIPETKKPMIGAN